MKKVILLIAILLVFSVSTSQAFFMIADPITTEGAANVKVPVHNNSGTALDEGDVVVWDVGSSTGDNDLYVTTTTTADTGLVAGVVSQGGIAVGDQGSIVVYGLAQCDIVDPGPAAGALLCTSGTAGGGTGCSTAALESMAYAITSSSAGTQVNCFVGVK